MAMTESLAAGETPISDSWLVRNKKWIVAFVLFGMYASFGMSWMGVVPLREVLNQFLEIDNAAGQRLFSIVSMAKSIVPILAGILAGRWGLTNTMRLSAVLIMTGLLIPFLPGYWAWVGLKFLFGVGGAIWVTLMGAVTMQVFEAKQRPLINAVNGVAITVGIILSLKLTLPLTAAFGGNWKLTLALYSLISAFFMLLLFLTGDLTPPAAVSAPAISLRDTLKAYAGTLKLPVTWVTSVGFFGPLALFLVLSYWLPVYYQDNVGIPKAQTLGLMIWMNLGAIVGAVGTGLLLQKFGKTKPFILAAALLTPAASLGCLFVGDKGLLPLILFLTGVGLFISVSPLITLLQSQPGLNPATVGMILGTMFSFTYIASYMAPETVALLTKSGTPLQLVLAAFCLTTISPAAGLLLPEKQA
ncbi:MAG: hypothetical protein CVV27_07640 [Candidatus Melainabacteria bacterium HGW-Melainabacteria-1]|nr:MAG: hypothetical protein CVV27_07640 [Candidatus Melainabacteria bacterium HGW-Melainabacteria-1]